MQLTVKLFAGFRNGRFDMEQRDYPAGIRIDAIVRDLGIPAEEVGILLRNGRHVELKDEVAAGDTLAIFPLIGGG